MAAAVVVGARVEAGVQGRAKVLLPVAAERRLPTVPQRRLDRLREVLLPMEFLRVDRKAEVEAEAVHRQRPPTDLRWQHSLTLARAFQGRCRRSRRGAWKS